MSRAFNLYRLQQVDTRLDRLRGRLLKIDALLAEDAAVRSAQAAHNSNQEALEEARRALTKAEQITGDHRLKIEQTENHLYSGKVTEPRELQDLQNEVAALKRYLETLEERELEAMLAFEESEAAFDESAENLEQVKAERISASAELQGEKSRLQEEVRRLESERTVAVISVTAEDREMYDRLRAKGRGVAVASASGGSCAACGSSLSSALHQAARAPSSIAYCDTCGRILYAE